MRKKRKIKKKIKRKLKSTSTKENKAYVKKHRQRNRKYVKLTCKKCNRLYKIHISHDNVHLYTDKLRKNYVCILCRLWGVKADGTKKTD